MRLRIAVVHRQPRRPLASGRQPRATRSRTSPGTSSTATVTFAASTGTDRISVRTSARVVVTVTIRTSHRPVVVLLPQLQGVGAIGWRRRTR